MSLEGIEFWYWWVAAVVFVVIEILAPGFVFIWLGIAAAVVGGTWICCSAFLRLILSSSAISLAVIPMLAITLALV